MKTLLNKIEVVKRPDTKKKYQAELKKKMDAALKKQRLKSLLLQEKRRKQEEKRLRKQLNAVIKRQKKLERERRIMENKFRKLKKEQELKSRLLSTEELSSVVNSLRNHRLGTEPLSQVELREIIGKFNRHKDEKARRGKMYKKLGKEIRDRKKRAKLNKKFEYLNDILKKVNVEETDRSTASRQILEFDSTLKGYGK